MTIAGYQKLLDHRRLSLIKRPTTLRRMYSLENKLECGELWLKDDRAITDIGGGSKVRNLEFLLGFAKTRGFTKIVGHGAFEGNFPYLLAAYANHLGLRTELFLTSITGLPAIELERKKQLLRELRSTVVEVTKVEIGVRDFIATHFSAGLSKYNSTFFIPVGGASPLGCLGPMDGALELCAQVEAGFCSMPVAIFVPLGSGGTLAGLYAGLRLANASTHLIGVRVGKGPAISSIKRLSDRTMFLLPELTEMSFTNNHHATRISILEGFTCGGFGRQTEQSDWTARLIEESESIDLDRNYTVKSMMAMLDHLKNASKSPVLFWLTCGRKT